jgi:hypothetical protein
LHFQQRRQLAFTPKSLLSVGKMASRATVVAGGTVAATVTYYQNKLASKFKVLLLIFFMINRYCL